MAAELLWRGLANGAVILAIVWVFRRRGQRVAGLLAALPVLSAPALFTLSFEHSPSVATAVAIAGLHATGLTASLVLFYGLACRQAGAAVALLLSGMGALLVAWLTCRIGQAFAPSLTLTLFLIGMARRLLPRLAPGGSVCRFLRGYLDGLLVRCTFLAVLAAALLPLGGWLAFPLAVLAAIATLMAITTLHRAPPGAAAPPPSGYGFAASRARRRSSAAP